MRGLLIFTLILVDLAAIVSSSVGLKLSAVASNWRGFLAWQVFGNLAGFVGVLAFTGLVRFIPLHIGYGLTAGLGFILVQVLGARLFFHEPIASLQWLGVSITALGIGLITFGNKT